jgi:Rrf2 family transcriptional regulator, cysteine metabolism repressor
LRLSTRGRYGIHAMYDLAVTYESGPQPLKAIAERQSVPEAYLEQLMAPLRREGLIKSVRGAQGGYLLARPPSEITVGQVLRTLEGDLAITECLNEEDACDMADCCPTRKVWKKVRDGLNSIVDGITLQDMLEDPKAGNLKGCIQ